MNNYLAEKMIKKSRLLKLFNTFDHDTQREILNRINELIKEENEYCDKGNYQHLCNILATIAIYEILQLKGKDKNDALKILNESIYEAAKPSSEKFKKLARLSGFWLIMKKIIPIGFKYGSGTGWRYTWYENKNKNEFRFDTNECIYQKIFKKRNMEELGPQFCHCDIINYGMLPGIDFQRTATLCYGDDKCNFKFVKYDLDEEFIRTESK